MGSFQICTRGQNCTSAQNCKNILLHEGIKLHKNKIARRLFAQVKFFFNYFINVFNFYLFIFFYYNCNS